ncbi:Pol Polyprotein [Phytophthora cinnamomi]|uniref:Pol Polyprotein n=1 Tax=Phytophthora cinnamomi TaxID=4785 RepID=UPI0035594C42|nr:Pol Polyprotein [Phytophthora cinnamomi]
MTDEITFPKTKANGAAVNKKFSVFRGGDWEPWLHLLLYVQEFQVFMGYTIDQGDQWVMAEVIQVLLFDEDLRCFNDIYRDEVEFM